MVADFIRAVRCHHFKIVIRMAVAVGITLHRDGIAQGTHSVTTTIRFHITIRMDVVTVALIEAVVEVFIHRHHQIHSR
ncbi:unnamed protein product [Anisakis simplex]|uniref:Uncharacterized protein n=1 Tax=Anisakis simplex TaxID=6269 RepID=A0A3P6Q635_ANISI|nr:unnamed protein product [Anisakis simplex]